MEPPLGNSCSLYAQQSCSPEVGMMSQTTFIWTIADTPANEARHPRAKTRIAVSCIAR